MKKIMAVLLSALTAICTLTSLSAFHTAAAGSWKSALTSYINALSGDKSARYKLVDIDADDIPEVVYYSGTGLGGMSVATYDGGAGVTTLELQSGTISYNQGKIHVFTGRQGTYHDQVYTLKNHFFTNNFAGTRAAQKPNFDLNNPNDFNFSYVLNSSIYKEHCSYAEYNNNLSSTFNFSGVKEIDMWDANVMNASQAINAVKNYLPRVQIISLQYETSDNELLWKSVDGAASYQIARKMTGESSYTYFTTNKTYFYDESFQDGVACTYQVRAFNGSSYGAWSASKSVVTLEKPLLAVSNKSNGIRAEWYYVPGATKYVVYYRRTDVASWSSVETKNTYYPFLNLTKGVSYSFQVRVIGKANGPYSSVATLVYNTVSNEKPTLALTNRNDGILASWNKIAGATTYMVYYREYNNSYWTSFETTQNAYLHKNPTIGKAYCFQVQPVFSGTKGAYSAVKTITYTVVNNAKPVVSLSNKSNGIRAEWNAIYGATSYIVYYRKYADKTWSSVETKNTYYPFLKAVQGTAYCFQVQPKFGDAKGAYSKVATIIYTTISQEKPVINIENRSNSVYLRWQQIAGAYAYIVYYRKDTDSQWQATQTTNLYFNYTKVTKGTRYAFQVQPVFAAGNGAYSAVTRITFTPTYG